MVSKNGSTFLKYFNKGIFYLLLLLKNTAPTHLRIRRESITIFPALSICELLMKCLTIECKIIKPKTVHIAGRTTAVSVPSSLLVPLSSVVVSFFFLRLWRLLSGTCSPQKCYKLPTLYLLTLSYSSEGSPALAVLRHY